MGQRLARREIEDGLQLYHQQNHEAAIRKWKRALHRISGRRDRFVALGYLAAAHGDCGKYRDMLAYAVQQIDTANETESTAMRAEAYWNLARSNERLCEYHKAVSYARHSLQNEPRDIRLHGYVYLCQANAYFGFSNFVSALENLGRAMSIAKQCGDTPLELHVFSSLGHIFTCLKDYEKGLNFHLKAVALAKSFDVCDISWKYDRMTSLNVVTPYRKLGRYEEAMECCEDAMKLALEDGDRPTQGKCLCCFADIHRNGNDMQRAIPRYEAAVSIMVEIGDRYGQIEALVGMAKSMLAAKQINKALDYNAKALDLATNIGNKMHMLRCRILLTDIYRLLGDTRMVAEEQCRCRRLQEDMQLICRACTKCLGESPNHLEFLPCCHLVHNRCAYEATRRGSSKNNRSSKFISCPTCSKDVPKDSVYL